LDAVTWLLHEILLYLLFDKDACPEKKRHAAFGERERSSKKPGAFGQPDESCEFEKFTGIGIQ
jgi:hypothetical protein